MPPPKAVDVFAVGGEQSFFCEEFLAQPAALRSRFSVVMLPLEEVLQQRLRSFSAQQQARVQNALERCEDLVRRLKPEADGGRGFKLSFSETQKTSCLFLFSFVYLFFVAGFPLTWTTTRKRLFRLGRCFPQPWPEAFCGMADHTVKSLLLSLLSRLVKGSPASLSSDLEGASVTVQLVVRLLQLMPPEWMLHAAPLLGREDFYQAAYFRQSHFSLAALLRAAHSQALRKLMLYTRQCAETYRLLHQAEEQGEVVTINVGEVDSTQALEALLTARIGAREPKSMILVVDMEHHENQHISWLRAFIDSKARIDTHLLFGLLLLYPPERVISGRLYPCIFLDEWEFFFLDSIGQSVSFDTGAILSSVATGQPSEHCVKEESMNAYVVDFCRRARLLPARAKTVKQDRAVVKREGGLLGKVVACVSWACECVLDSLEANSLSQADRFYAENASCKDRSQALMQVLHQRPEIWRHLVATFHTQVLGDDLQQQITRIAQEVRSGQKLMSLSEGVRLFLHLKFQDWGPGGRNVVLFKTH